MGVELADLVTGDGFVAFWGDTLADLGVFFGEAFSDFGVCLGETFADFGVFLGEAFADFGVFLEEDFTDFGVFLGEGFADFGVFLGDTFNLVAFGGEVLPDFRVAKGEATLGVVIGDAIFDTRLDSGVALGEAAGFALFLGEFLTDFGVLGLALLPLLFGGDCRGDERWPEEFFKRGVSLLDRTRALF